MDAKRAERLAQKYATNSSVGRKEMSVGGHQTARDQAMRVKGKPKNLRRTVSRLARYLSAERLLVVLAVFFALLYTVGSLGAAYLLRPIINRFISGHDPRGLAGGLGIMAAVYAVSAASQYLQQRIMLAVSQRSLDRMRRELYAKIQTLPLRFFDTNAAGDVMSRFTNDVDTVGEMLNTTLIQIISGAITIIGTIALMLYTNWILALITVIMTPVLVLVSRTILKKGQGAYTAQQRDLGTLNGFAEETISGQKVVKVFNREEVAEDEFGYLNDKLTRSQIKAQFLAGIMGPVTHQLCNLTYAITACVGGILVVLRGFDIGGLTVLLNYTRQFNRPINEISMQMNTVFAALAGAERVFEVLDETPEPDVKGEAADIRELTGRVTFDRVRFGYRPDVPVLFDVSLTAEPGQTVALVGSTGAGKTTIANLLTRFYDTTDGVIAIDGVPIDRIDRSLLRRSIAMVLQDTHLFTGTVRENIRYGRPDATDSEVEQAAVTASAHPFISRLPDGYETMLSQDGASLSQGQRQLLNIARAAISRAPILILDEATSSVDTRTERYIQEGMDALMSSRTTFVIAHRLSTVRKADQILVLEHGRIIERGTHAQLLQAGGRYAALYNETAELE